MMFFLGLELVTSTNTTGTLLFARVFTSNDKGFSRTHVTPLAFTLIIAPRIQRHGYTVHQSSHLARLDLGYLISAGKNKTNNLGAA